MATAPSGPLSSTRHWTGKWVWSEGEAKPYHFFLFARGSFQLDDAPLAATLRITASDRYLLYVNGTYIGRGPARSDPRRKSYDTYDVAARLHAGRNTIAVRAYHYGTPPRSSGWGSWSGNAYTVGERSGLLVQLDLEVASGATRVIGTDDSWRVAPARGWDRGVKLINALVGSTEVYDADADPADWMREDFDDSDWEHAWTVPDGELDWVLLEARQTPLLTEREVFATRVVEVGEVIDQVRPDVPSSDIPELLNGELHFPLENAAALHPEALLRDDGRPAEFRALYVRGKGIRTPYVILDFGRQICGFPRVRLRAEKGAILDMTYGQELLAGRVPPALRYGDRYIAREGRQTWDLAEYKQLRYLHITLRSVHAPIYVESVAVNEYTYPADERGSFECSDPSLTRLWRACVDTTYLNMEDTLVHEGFRERAVFSTGDGSHIMHMVFAAFGDLPITDRFLRLVPLSERGDGMMQMVYPPENPPRYVVPQFLLQWSTRVREHYMFTGRDAVLEELYRSVPPQIDWYEPHRDEMGFLRDLPLQNTLDWAPNDLRGASLITNALYVAGLEDAAWLADRVGAARDAVRWRSIARQVRDTLREVFWDEERGVYQDSHHRGELTGVASEIGNALALLYDIATHDQVSRIGEGFAKPDSELVEATPLFFGYVADALIRAGMTETALELSRTRFGPMLSHCDNPTIWELWDPYSGGYRILTDDDYAERKRGGRVRPMSVRCLAHTGGVLIGFVLSTRVLGVMPTGPGFSTVRIQPRTGDLEWARGVFPSPRGDIRVEWKRDCGALVLQAVVPEGVGAEVVLEREVDRSPVLTHNGQSVPLKEPGAPVQPGDAIVEPDSVRLTVPAGEHVIDLSHSG